MSEFSSLEKVNVRRLLLKCKEIYETIFEHVENISTNREFIILYYNNLLKKSTIHSYKVVCDETNNTPSIIEKSNRWIGFIQGVLWSLDVFSIEDLRGHVLTIQLK